MTGPKTPDGSPDPGAARGGVAAEVSLLVAVALAAVAGVQLLRVYLPLATFYLYDARGLSPLITALCSLAFLTTGFAAPWLARRIGWRPTVAVTALLLAVVRGAEQWIRRPAVDVWLAAAGTALFSLLLALSLLAAAQSSERRFGVAFSALLGLAAETTLRALAGSFDLSWRADAWTTGIVSATTLATVAAAALAMRREREPAPPASCPWAWAGLGAWMALYLLVFSNPAHLAARSGMPLEQAATFVLGGWALGLGVVALRLRNGNAVWHALGAAPVIALGAWAAVYGGRDAWFGYLIGTPILAGYFIDLVAARPAKAGRSFAAGGAGPVLLLLVYLCYGRFDQPYGPSETVVYVAAVVILLTGSLATAWRARPQRLPRAWRFLSLGPAVLVGLAAAAVWHLSAPLPVATPVSGGPVRLMTYNLHQGFSASGRLDPEGLARVIAAESADVVALQEVARGWLVAGGLDLHDWLMRRLEMPGEFAGTADAQWGNAVLSRMPVLASTYHPLPPDDLPLRRGVLDVTIGVGKTPLRVLCLHLHHRWRDDEIRVRQTEALLELWGGTPATVLLGDFNAEPDSDAILMLRAAGLRDASEQLPEAQRATIVGRGPSRQIDWIFATADLDLDAPAVARSPASDHQPVAVTVRFRRAAGIRAAQPDVPGRATASSRRGGSRR